MSAESWMKSATALEATALGSSYKVHQYPVVFLHSALSTNLVGMWHPQYAVMSNYQNSLLSTEFRE